MKTCLPTMLLSVLVLGACEDNQTGTPAPGHSTLWVTVATLGGDPDEDGYTLIIDGQAPKALAPNQTIQIPGLSSGTHQVELVGLESNCGLQGPPLRSVAIPSSGDAEVRFTVECLATGIEVANATTGIDLSIGYSIRVDSRPEVFLPINGTWTVSRLSPGKHSVVLLLGSAAGNCQSDPVDGFANLDVPLRTLVRVSFGIVCVARFGTIKVILPTSGTETDATGFQARVDGGPSRAFIADGTLIFDGLPMGDHLVEVTASPSNCTLVGSNAKTVPVSAGGLIRQVTQVDFPIACTEFQRPIAFTRWPYEAPHWGYDPFIALADESGDHLVLRGGGYQPTWSPDGLELAFIRVTQGCYYTCSSDGVYRMLRDGTGIRRLTENAADAHPVWSPAGGRIAFERNGQLWLMNPDGSSPAQLQLPVIRARQPAWSPDGTRLAFTCVVTQPIDNVCVVNANGTGFLKLSVGANQDFGPAWSPDGNRLAFATLRYSAHAEIALMNIDGSGVTRLTEGDAPAWSPDGTRLLFSEDGAVMVINADGSGRRRLVSEVNGFNYSPVWRR